MYPIPGNDSSTTFQWSPGYKNPPARMKKNTFMALKRAEIALSGFIIPVSQLWSPETDGIFGLYYWKTPRDNTWMSLDLQRLSESGTPET